MPLRHQTRAQKEPKMKHTINARTAAAATATAVVTVLLAACTPSDASPSSTVPINAANADSLDIEAVSRPFRSPTLTSGLTVPAGETFILGERPSGDFTVSALNKGQTTARIIASRDGNAAPIATLPPGETVIARFKSNDAVLIQNVSTTQRAEITVEVWGTQNLSMYYRPNNDPDNTADLNNPAR
jgi:hypothetical protein